jgi:hypothetical protein
MKVMETMSDTLPPNKRIRGKSNYAPSRTTTTSGTARKKPVSKPSRRSDFDDSDDDAPTWKVRTSGPARKNTGSKPPRRNDFDDSDDDDGDQYVGESADLDVD